MSSSVLCLTITSWCEATCYPGYMFPNGHTVDRRECDYMYNAWFDPPGKNIPNCISKSKWLYSLVITVNYCCRFYHYIEVYDTKLLETNNKFMFGYEYIHSVKC